MIYELKTVNHNDFAPLVESEGQDLPLDQFHWNGMEKHWSCTPRVEKFFDKRRKKQKERADFGWFSPGTVALNERAYAHVGEFFSQFGQLLELDCADGKAWLYNVTNIIECVDAEKSVKFGDIVDVEALDESHVPQTAQIFKDRLTAGRRIYLNEAAKQVLERVLQEHQLTGVAVTEAGLPPF